jgi:hypothetical protein
MSDKALLLHTIETLPASYLDEVANFVEFLKQKRLKDIPLTMAMSEAALAKDWNSPEEDTAWANL